MQGTRWVVLPICSDSADSKALANRALLYLDEYPFEIQEPFFYSQVIA